MANEARRPGLIGKGESRMMSKPRTRGGIVMSVTGRVSVWGRVNHSIPPIRAGGLVVVLMLVLVVLMVLMVLVLLLVVVVLRLGGRGFGVVHDIIHLVQSRIHLCVSAGSQQRRERRERRTLLGCEKGRVR